MKNDKEIDAFMKALAEVQKQYDLIISDMIKRFINSKFKSNG